jgi:hypothetical protein
MSGSAARRNHGSPSKKGAEAVKIQNLMEHSKRTSWQSWFYLSWNFLTATLLAIVLWIVIHGLQGTLTVLYTVKRNPVITRWSLLILGAGVMALFALVLGVSVTGQIRTQSIGAKDPNISETVTRLTQQSWRQPYQA